jgi:hypothetical protein
MNGIYKLDGVRIGTVSKFDPAEWYGYVTLDVMPDNAEFGALDSSTTVDVDGKEYRQGGE